jgi:transposase
MTFDQLLLENQTQQATIRTLREEIELLKDQLTWFQRQIFGQKTERFIPSEGQLAFDLGVAVVQPPVKEIPVSYTKRSVGKPTPHGRETIPAHLPRQKIIIKPDFDTTGMVKIGEKISEELHYKAPEFFVKQSIREIWSKELDNGECEIKCAELPARCIDKGKAGASLVAQTIVTKCVDHNPLYRFGQQIERYCDMKIPYSTIEGWFIKGTFWLESLSDRLHEIVKSSGYMQMDETTLRVMIHPTNGKSHLGYMILCHSPPRKIVTFHYRYTRNQTIVRELIGENYQGVIQTDGLDIYKFLSSQEGVVHAGCWAHGRRGFDESLGNDKQRAVSMLDKCKFLFAVEAHAKEQALGTNERLALRMEKSAPIVTDIKQWLDDNLTQVTPKSPIGKAIAYMLGRWNEMTAFLKDGRIEISDNGVENRVRPFAVGRKNFMFAGSENGARRLAVAYTVLGTCLLHGINPFEYLSDVLERIPARKANNIDDLLPMNWKPAQK